jgi:biopolymer transport protein ExbD
VAFGASPHSRVRSEINVTPLVDVVLVLLIIFLVTMPILLEQIRIEVPRKEGALLVPEPAIEQVLVELKDGRLFVSGTEIARPELGKAVSDALSRRRDKVVFVDFDDDARYGDAVAIMDTCKGAGASTVAIVLESDAP